MMQYGRLSSQLTVQNYSLPLITPAYVQTIANYQMFSHYKAINAE